MMKKDAETKIILKALTKMTRRLDSVERENYIFRIAFSLLVTIVFVCGAVSLFTNNDKNTIVLKDTQGNIVAHLTTDPEGNPELSLPNEDRGNPLSLSLTKSLIGYIKDNGLPQSVNISSVTTSKSIASATQSQASVLSSVITSGTQITPLNAAILDKTIAQALGQELLWANIFRLIAERQWISEYDAKTNLRRTAIGSNPDGTVWRVVNFVYDLSDRISVLLIKHADDSFDKCFHFTYSENGECERVDVCDQSGNIIQTWQINEP